MVNAGFQPRLGEPGKAGVYQRYRPPVMGDRGIQLRRVFLMLGMLGIEHARVADVGDGVRIARAFHVPPDHSLRADILQNGDGAIHPFQQALRELRPAGVSGYVQVGVVEPAVRIARPAFGGFGDEKLPDGPAIGPAHLHRLAAAPGAITVRGDHQRVVLHAAEADGDMRGIAAARRHSLHAVLVPAAGHRCHPAVACGGLQPVDAGLPFRVKVCEDDLRAAVVPPVDVRVGEVPVGIWVAGTAEAVALIHPPHVAARGVEDESAVELQQVGAPPADIDLRRIRQHGGDVQVGAAHRICDRQRAPRVGEGDGVVLHHRRCWGGGKRLFALLRIVETRRLPTEAHGAAAGGIDVLDTLVHQRLQPALGDRHLQHLGERRRRQEARQEHPYCSHRLPPLPRRQARHTARATTPQACP
jgi:hypothetical protein